MTGAARAGHLHVQADHTHFESAEHGIAAVLGHRRTHARIHQFLDLADNLIVLAGTMALIATRRIVRQHRAAGGEVLHADAENGRLHQVTLALVLLGHRDEVGAAEDAHPARPDKSGVGKECVSTDSYRWSPYH